MADLDQDLADQIRLLGPEDRVRAAWLAGSGRLPRPWTEVQRFTYDLGIFTCPEGHRPGVDTVGTLCRLDQFYRKFSPFQSCSDADLDEANDFAEDGFTAFWCEACEQGRGGLLHGGFFLVPDGLVADW